MMNHHILGPQKKIYFSPSPPPCTLLSSFTSTSASWCDLPVQEARNRAKWALNVNAVRKRRVALSLCADPSHSACAEWLRHALWPCPSIIVEARCQRVQTQHNITLTGKGWVGWPSWHKQIRLNKQQGTCRDEDSVQMEGKVRSWVDKKLLAFCWNAYRSQADPTYN